jgi:hypothetical protein
MTYISPPLGFANALLLREKKRSIFGSVVVKTSLLMKPDRVRRQIYSALQNGFLLRQGGSEISRPGSGSGPSPKNRLGFGLLLNKPKARARMVPGFGLGTRVGFFAYLVKTRDQAQPKPEV